MKRILSLLVIVLLAACGEKTVTPEKETIPLADKIVGNWHCNSAAVDAEIYTTFNMDGTFILYQQIGEGAYRVYNGTYNLSESEEVNTLTGKYNDGIPWGAEYELAMTEDAVMTLTASGITETYTKLSGDIPEEVLRSCVTIVKSLSDDAVPFL